MRIVFFGTPDYVLPVLGKLHKTFKTDKIVSPIVGVVTQSPKPTGRKQIVTYSSVDAWAHQRKIPVYYDAFALLKDSVKADIGVIAAYGSLLPESLVSYFPHGILVVHPSLLPQFRWGSPVQAAIATGINPTGVSIIKMDAKFDHGPIISQFEEEVTTEDTTGSLRARLFERSADVLAELIEPFVQGKITPKKQDEREASFARTIKKEDGFIPPEVLKLALDGKESKDKRPIAFIKDFETEPNAESLNRFIRAMNPWPCAWTMVKGIGLEEKRLKIISGSVENGKLILDQVQLEAKEPVDWNEFMRGYPNASF